MTLFEDYLILALIGGLGIALIAAPLGVFMVWQRQAYFGATLAHSALLGISLGLYLQLDLTLSIIVLSMLIALSIHWLKERTHLSSDTLLGILAHSTLALGLVFLSLQDNMQVDIMGYLFGDILNVSSMDLALIAAVGVLIVIFYLLHWEDLLNLTINPQLAAVEGTPVKRVQILYILLLALMIALSMKVVGVLLVTSLLIIPAAGARRLASTPHGMLAYTLIIGVVSVVLGLVGSLHFDLPAGPAIVLAATLLFTALLIKKAPL